MIAINKLKNLIKRFAGFKSFHFGEKCVGLIHETDVKEAWFAYWIQLRKILEEFDIDLVIDVGANRGDFAAGIRKIYKGEIISFEPVSSVFNELEERASHDTKWNVYNFALGSQNHLQEINISSHTVFSSFLDTNEFCLQEFGATSKAIKKETVSICRLEDFLKDYVPNSEKRKVFLKMDTQGYDMEVFKGLGERIQSVHLLQSEMSIIPVYKDIPHWIDSLSYFEQFNFTVVGFFPVNIDWPRIIEYDCLMIKKSA